MSASKELVVSQSRHETKVAILEDGQLVEVYFQRANEYSLAGSIHKGRVTRVLPGMQSAFVDLGLDRDCFLYVSDFWEEHGDEVERVSDDRRGERRPGGRDRGRGDRDRDREREREPERLTYPPAPEVEFEAPPVPAELEPEVVEAAAASEELAPERPAPVAAPESETAAQIQDRRRRSRRRRGGRGFPESKYAGDEAAPAAPEAEPEPTPEYIPEPLPRIAAPSAEVFILPGESLAKYRRPAVEPVAPRRDREPEPERESAPETEVRIDPASTPTAEEVAEQVLERVEEIEEHASHAPEPEPEPIAGPESEPEAEAAVETEEESESEGATGEDGDEETSEEAASEENGGEKTVEGEEGVEPARMPQSLTATLRTQGDRLPRRLARRRRRRGGRGGPDALPEAVEATGVEVREVVAEAPERPRESREPREPREQERERDKDRPRTPPPSITELLKEGQEIIVQIAKEPLGQKGARITSHIALPGRYVVYMPTVDHLGVSRKIASDDERQRLKRILQKHRESVAGGFIMRTAGEGKTEEDIASDMNYLANLWLDIRQKAEKRRAPALLHHDVEVVQRLLRDHLNEGFKAVWVDTEELYEGVLHSVERLQPALLSRVKLYTRPEPIFDAFGITGELDKALRPKVWLKSGGYIVINQTEALVAIDVNTGKYVGKSHRLEDTIVRTNLEAVKEISRQVRLRDLGGIIVVDFIDMDERKNRQKVMQSLEETMRADKAPYKILQFNDFGLVAITRKRVKQSLERTLCAPCPYCEGAGYVKSVPTIIGEILVQAQKYAKVVDGQEVMLRVNPDVAKELKSVETKYLEELEEILGRAVLVTGDPLLHQEKFDLT